MSIERLRELSSLTANDQLLELGCGRGRGCFFLHALTGCQVTGVDHVPKFIDIGLKMVKRYQMQGVHFLCQEMTQVDLSHATVIYLYGTCLEEGTIHPLIDSFKELPPSVKIITVSYPLSDYTDAFVTKAEITAQFPWGEGEVFLNQSS